MAYLFIALLFVAGILACAPIIVAKRPDARVVIDKLVPYQALIGLLLMAMGFIYLVHVGPTLMIRMVKAMPLVGVTMLGSVLIAIVLGFLFGLPQIAKMSPNTSARAGEIAEQIAPYQMLIGLGALGAGAILLLFSLGILKLDLLGIGLG